MFDEADTGSLEIGKAADLVVLGADPLTCKPSEIAQIPVLATVMNGRLTYLSDEAPRSLEQLDSRTA
jgi:predicted amidohydrolase YtcJ